MLRPAILSGKPHVSTAATASVASAPHLANPDLNPSFTKGLFLGEIREDLVFPFPALASEERESLRMIVDSFRAFAEDHVDSRQLDHDGRFPDAVRAGMAELWLMGLNIPEAYGGFGASAKVFNRVFGEIGSTDPALCVYFGAHQSIGCKGIVLFGSEEHFFSAVPARNRSDPRETGPASAGAAGSAAPPSATGPSASVA